MAAEIKKVEDRYEESVQSITLGPSWAGQSAYTAHINFAATRYEYSAAQTQAIALLLQDAHADFVRLRKNLETKRAEAVAASLRLAAMPRQGDDGALSAVPTANSRALGGYDAIAADVVRDIGGTAGKEWTDVVFPLLSAPSPTTGESPAAALSDRITKSWRETLATVPPGRRLDHLRQQSVLMLSTWADAQKITAAQKDSLRALGRESADSVYPPVLRSLDAP